MRLGKNFKDRRANMGYVLAAILIVTGAFCLWASQRHTNQTNIKLHDIVFKRINNNQDYVQEVNSSVNRSLDIIQKEMILLGTRIDNVEQLPLDIPKCSGCAHWYRSGTLRCSKHDRDIEDPRNTICSGFEKLPTGEVFFMGEPEYVGKFPERENILIKKEN
jgi:hypothetical protein